MLTFQYREYEVRLLNEPFYNLTSVDNAYIYEHEYVLDHYISSQHGLRVLRDAKILHSCILAASNGSTRVHSKAARIINDTIYIAVGNRLCSLALPTLNLQWQLEVDNTTCYGVHYHTAEDCLLTHGEVTISRISKNDRLIWQTSGNDIFTGESKIIGDYIESIDFNHEKYRIRISDGHRELVSE